VRFIKFTYLIIGVGLLALLVLRSDSAAVLNVAGRIGFAIVPVMALYAARVAVMSFVWSLSLTELPWSPLWLGRILVVRTVGDAINLATPFAQMGGEVIKVMVLKRRYGIALGEGAASLITSRTALVFALVLFLAVGYGLIAGESAIATGYQWSTGLGLMVFAAAVAGFYLVQRWRLLSRSGALFLRRRLGKLAAGLIATEDRLLAFYRDHPKRFAVAIAAGFFQWFLGVATLYVILAAIGHPLGWRELWMAEAFVQLVRATTFFVPANLGTQEGAFMLVIGVLGGDPSVGLAAALIRRLPEVAFIALGLLLGWRYTGHFAYLKEKAPPLEGAEENPQGQ